MISYAQDCEDVLLRRVFPDGSIGRYVDVGANDPVLGSVTKHFLRPRAGAASTSSRSRRLLDRLRADRPRDVNLNLGLSDREGCLTFYEAPEISRLVHLLRRPRGVLSRPQDRPPGTCGPGDHPGPRLRGARRRADRLPQGRRRGVRAASAGRERLETLAAEGHRRRGTPGPRTGSRWSWAPATSWPGRPG